MSARREYLDLPPLAAAAGTVRLPGSKSISNRVLLLAALSNGATQIHDVLDSDDTRHMIEALEKLGVRVEGKAAQGHLIVHGCAGLFPVRDADLFLGNAGTAIRPLTAALAFANGRYRLSGVPRMHERPIGDLVDALRGLGADVRYTGNEGFPPLEIHPSGATEVDRVSVRGDVSSQFLTALLMAAPVRGGGLSIDVIGELISKPYIEITLNLMARFGVAVRREGWTRFTVPAASQYRSPGEVHVEGDASGASYFLAAGAIGGGPVRVEGVGAQSIQGDVRFAEALRSLGATISMGPNWIEASGPTASAPLRAFDLDLNHIPDAAMTLAVAALFTDGTCHLRNIASWRVKETDRLAAMANELRKVGARVVETSDALSVTPPQRLRGAAIRTYDDHRMAMCFSLVALGGVPVRIQDPDCVAKTYPDYFERYLERATLRRVPVIAIDGPSASGKGTVAQMVAGELGFRFLDSGALYRLVALRAYRLGLRADQADALAGQAESLQPEFNNDRIELDGEDVTDAIREEQVSELASKIATVPEVRHGLLWAQRAFRAAPGLVADGRDMASVVFPDAELKVYLTASVEARAERRHKQLKPKGMHVTLPTLLAEIAKRDQRDSARSIAPLKQTADARLLDTTLMTAEQAAQQVVQWFREL